MLRLDPANEAAIKDRKPKKKSIVVSSEYKLFVSRASPHVIIIKEEGLSEACEPEHLTMSDILFFVAIIVVYLLLQIWILPRLGVPT